MVNTTKLGKSPRSRRCGRICFSSIFFRFFYLFFGFRRFRPSFRSFQASPSPPSNRAAKFALERQNLSPNGVLQPHFEVPPPLPQKKRYFSSTLLRAPAYSTLPSLGRPLRKVVLFCFRIE